MIEDHNIISSSLFTNDLFINEYLLKKNQVESYQIIYCNFSGNEEIISINYLNHFSLNRLINYGSLNIKNPTITLRLKFINNKILEKRFKGNYWGFNIEQVSRTKIKGWIVHKNNLILRPFHLKINSQESWLM